MDKPRSRIPEPSPSLDGPDYVALVIEWDEMADTLEETRLSQLQRSSETSELQRSSETQRSSPRPPESTHGGMAAASSRGMPTPHENSDWTRVDEASDESFPASDPPAWGSSHAVAEPAAPVDEPDEVTGPMTGVHARHEMKLFAYAKQLALGLLALGALLTFVEGMRRLRPVRRTGARAS